MPLGFNPRQKGELRCGFSVQVNSKVKSEPLPCPGAQAVKEALQLPASIGALVYSLAELTDARRGETLEVCLDEQQHPRQSLLNPLLGDCQGPALCFSIPGEALSKYQ